MFAVIKTGGKQYRVAANDVLKIEKVAGKIALEEAVGMPTVLNGNRGGVVVLGHQNEPARRAVPL